MDQNERSELLETRECTEQTQHNYQKTLSLFFAALCVIDLFGVFPIVALPKSVIQCGLYGIPLVLFVITMQIYTAVVLGRCWIIAERLKPSIVEQNRYPYAAIAELSYGKRMSVFVTILLDLTVFGGGIPNLLVASQNLQLLGSRISHGGFELSFCYWLIILGCLLCPIMWLGSPKNMKVLASISVTVCTTVAILTWYSIFEDSAFALLLSNGTEEIVVEPFAGLSLTPPPAINLLKAYGIIAFQFDVHPMLLTIQVDMKKKQRIGRAVCYGIFTTGFFSLTTTAIAAYRYGQFTTSNVLEILPRSWTLYFVILLVTLQLCLSSAVGNSALFQHVEDFLGVSRNFTCKRCIIRSSLVGLAVFIGELLPKFDVVMGIIGGTLTGPLIFILPPLFYTKITQMEKEFERQLEQKRQESTSEDGGLFKEVEERVKRKHEGYGTMFNYLAIVPEEDERETSDKTVDFTLRRLRDVASIMRIDCLLSAIVIVFGLAATFTSTYYNIFDIGTADNLWSPCFVNFSSTLRHIYPV